MKNYLRIISLLIILLFLVACDSRLNKTTEPEVEEEILEQDLSVISQDEYGEVTKGTLEGYTFVETNDVTDRVKIQMETGEIILIVLSNKDAPITIKNFKKLVKEKFYDGIIFHRVILNFVIQAGDPTGTGYSGSKETIKGEFSLNKVTNNLSHTRGVVSMARSSDNFNSASSQFFICQADNTYLDGGYAAFGKVFAGMDAVDFIAHAETDINDKPLKDYKIKSIRFITIEKT